jgi:hypothetical protein
MTPPPPPSDDVNPYAPPRAALGPRVAAGGPRRSDRWAIVLSFLIVSTLGCLFLLGFWSARRRIDIGLIRSVGFVVITAGVHFVGYRIYRRQGDGAGTQRPIEDGDAGPYPRAGG